MLDNTEKHSTLSALFWCTLWQCLLNVQKIASFFQIFFSKDNSHSWTVEQHKLCAPHACDGGEKRVRTHAASCQCLCEEKWKSCGLRLGWYTHYTSHSASFFKSSPVLTFDSTHFKRSQMMKGWQTFFPTFNLIIWGLRVEPWDEASIQRSTCKPNSLKCRDSILVVDQFSSLSACQRAGSERLARVKPKCQLAAHLMQKYHLSPPKQNKQTQKN